MDQHHTMQMTIQNSAAQTDTIFPQQVDDNGWRAVIDSTLRLLESNNQASVLVRFVDLGSGQDTMSLTLRIDVLS